MANPSNASTADHRTHAQTIPPEDYINAHQMQRSMNIKTLELLQMSFCNKPTASQQFIDLGCGPGDFTRQELLPRCQPCRRIVATDISPDMVEYARDNFAHPQIEYEVHDVQSDVAGLVNKYGKFDRVYSFFALNWAKDLTAALRNVADLMTDDGECLLVFPARVVTYSLWRRIVDMDRWKEYKELIELFIPASHDIEDRSALNCYMLGILESANLKPRTCEVLIQDVRGVDMKQVIDTQISLTPILPLLSEESKADLKKDLVKVASRFFAEKPAGDPQYLGLIFLVHARKI